MSTQYLEPKSTIVTSLNGERGDVEITLEKLGIEEAIANKADKNHTHDYAGSRYPGGPAIEAAKLTVDDGAVNSPIYFDGEWLSIMIPQGLLSDDSSKDMTGNWTPTDGSQFYAEIVVEGLEGFKGVTIVLPSGTPDDMFTNVMLNGNTVRIYAKKIPKFPLNCYVLENDITKFVYETKDIDSITFPKSIDYTIDVSIPSGAKFTDTTYEQATSTTSGLIKLYDDVGTNIDGSMTQRSIKNGLDCMLPKSKIVDVVLYASNWVGGSAPYTYTLNIPGVTEYSHQDFIYAENKITRELIYLELANIQDGGQSKDTVILKAYNKKPTIDLPLRVLMRYDGVSQNYLTFSSPDTFTLKVDDKGWDGIIEYSIDTMVWNVWDGTEISSAINGNKYRLYLRGIGNSGITKSLSKSCSFKFDVPSTQSYIKCDGNIENLLDYETVKNNEHPVMSDMCYGYLFAESPLLTPPKLPANTLTVNCYRSMFEGCTKLSVAPDLPSTTLADCCYDSMFNGCTNLCVAPKLPATILASHCYYSMFRNTGLVEAPNLPSTNVENYNQCYSYMFAGCQQLVKAPIVSITTICPNCCIGMFSGCTSLTSIPELNSTTLKYECYASMFYGCTSIKLSTIQTEEYTIPYQIPYSGTGIIAANSLYNMFTNTGGTFTGTPEINITYYLSNTNSIMVANTSESEK